MFSKLRSFNVEIEAPHPPSALSVDDVIIGVNAIIIVAIMCNV